MNYKRLVKTVSIAIAESVGCGPEEAEEVWRDFKTTACHTILATLPFFVEEIKMASTNAERSITYNSHGDFDSGVVAAFDAIDDKLAEFTESFEAINLLGAVTDELSDNS